MSAYDPAWVRAFYDSFGEREWYRWDSGPLQSIRFAVHLHYLQSFVKPGDRVLEIGAGAGRFTRELAHITDHMTVGEISPVQLQLNRQNAATYGFETAVERWVECDMCDLSPHSGDHQFDAVVSFGGPLSYTLERRSAALQELRRVTTAGGVVLLSVMSLLGSIHQWLPESFGAAPTFSRRILRTGDVTEQDSGWSVHRHHLFRANELRELLSSVGLTPVAMSASNSVSATWDKELEVVVPDQRQWRQLIDVELEASRELGCLDMGTHIIAVCRA